MMRPHKLAILMSVALAFAVHAGVARASATVDLIRIDVSDAACLDPDRRDCPQLETSISSVATSDDITLAVILTAGPEGFFSGGVSVDYSDALPSLSVIGFRSLRTPPYLMFHFGQTTDQPPYISNINAVSAPFARMGIGLPAGQSAYIGTVSFHTERTGPSLAKIAVATDGPDGTDDLGRLGDYANISATTTFNSAYVVRAVASRPCGPVEIEVNTLHTAGSKVQAGPDQSVDVTAKARIRKGTAPAGTILPTTLEIRAFDGSIPIGRNATPESAIELEVGKDGNGATLPVEVPRCTTGSIRFWATFTGLNLDRLICNGARTITLECK